MEISNINSASYGCYQDKLSTPPTSRRCPCCGQRLPECYCGYGMMELKPEKPAFEKGVQKIFKVLGRVGKKLFLVKRHQPLLHSN